MGLPDLFRRKIKWVDAQEELLLQLQSTLVSRRRTSTFKFFIGPANFTPVPKTFLRTRIKAPEAVSPDAYRYRICFPPEN